MNTEPRVDAYIEKSADFAKPILQTLRSLIHEHCPEIVETIKWGMPMFVYHDSILCNIAAFKNHCGFGFWLHKEMTDVNDIFKRDAEGGMGSLGKLRSVQDIPSSEDLKLLILQGIQLIDSGVKLKRNSKPVKEKDSRL